MKAQLEKKTGNGASDAASKPSASSGTDIVELDETVRLLHTSRSTLYRWIREGRIRAMKAGRQWRFRREDIARFLEGEKPSMGLPLSPAPFVRDLESRLKDSGVDPETAIAPPGSESEETEERDSLARSIRLLCALAIRRNASDIHVAPHMEEDGRVRVPVRLRVNGTLETVADLDPRLLPHFMAEWKRLAHLDVTLRARPQDGKWNIRFDDSSYTLRLCFLPSMLGESVVARIFQPTDRVMKLEECGFFETDRRRIEKAIGLPNGLVLFTGPAGSGKTTVLFAALSRIDGSKSKILGVDNGDLLYCALPWVNFVSVNEEQGVTQAVALDYLMKSDPDIVVAEVSDAETLSRCANLALTGHLVLAGMHARGAFDALEQMLEWSDNRFSLPDAIRLIVSQRLAQRVCSKCAKDVRPKASEVKKIEAILKKGGIDPKTLKASFRDGAGCKHCSQSGTKGRRVYAETLEVSKSIREALRAGESLDKIRELARAEGMTTLAADLARRAYEGQVAVREVWRLLDLRSRADRRARLSSTGPRSSRPETPGRSPRGTSATEARRSKSCSRRDR